MSPSLDELLERFSDDALDRAFAAINEPRLKEQYAKTVSEVFDAATLEALQKLISHGSLSSLDYPVKTGKEGNVFHGTAPSGAPVAVKIFRTATSTFRSHMDYIIGDPRFKDVKPTKREIVYAWARKEYRNLQEIMAADVDVPTPLIVEKNVLVMEWIGQGGIGTPAPMLKDVVIEDPGAVFERLCVAMQRIVNDAGLVHGDFSEFNVLVSDERLVVMDVGQAVVRSHPRAQELLERDATNVCRFFRKLGVDADPKALLARIDAARKAAKEEE